ncbi:phosphatase domain-containing protein [Desulfonema limicola]|uniref:Phosphatase domain-containing protein n=1 Tax=Desulfonema limicola TaxID=45656 RepID=A0A975B7P6_9BACT|nr:phosphatase domain-containing protein [Desulfonema limicola]
MQTIKKEEGEVLLLECGDIFPHQISDVQTEPDCKEDTISENSESEVIARILVNGMNQMGYTAMAPGPFDFSLGLEFLEKISSEFTFPLITSNLVYKKNGVSFGKKYLIKKIGNINVGIIGIMAVDSFKVLPITQQPMELEIIPPEQALADLLPEVKQQADAIILLSQCSYEETNLLLKSLKEINFAIVSGNIPEQEQSFERIVLAKNLYGTTLGCLNLFPSPENQFTIKSKTILLDKSIPKDEIIHKMIIKEIVNRRDREVEKQAKALWRLSPQEYLEYLQKQQTDIKGQKK